MKSTDLNLIPVFVAVYEERNLSKAATRLAISQPAVSQALSRLRVIHDDPLFRRAALGVEPTPTATDIYPAMAASLKNYMTTLATSRDFNYRTSNRVFSIACISAASFELLPKTMELINRMASGITLEVHPLFTADYTSDLRLQKYDVILDLTPQRGTTLKHEAIATDSLVAVCRTKHPTLRKTLTMQQFLSLGHVVASRWHPRRSLLNAEHYSELDKRKVMYRASGLVEILPVVERSDYIAMFPKSVVRCFAGKYDVRTLPLPFEIDDLELSMVWHPSRTNEPSHKWLRSKLRLAAKEIFI